MTGCLSLKRRLLNWKTISVTSRYSRTSIQGTAHYTRLDRASFKANREGARLRRRQWWGYCTATSSCTGLAAAGAVLTTHHATSHYTASPHHSPRKWSLRSQSSPLTRNYTSNIQLGGISKQPTATTSSKQPTITQFMTQLCKCRRW